MKSIAKKTRRWIGLAVLAGAVGSPMSVEATWSALQPPLPEAPSMEENPSEGEAPDEEESPAEFLAEGGSGIAEFVTPEIQALAEGLQRDPKRIFDYVHDHIRYRHYFGSKKGAQLTLLERSGNDFDQCALLVALLRAAGHTNVGYQFGTVRIPYEADDRRDFRRWLGLTKPGTNWSEVRQFVSLLHRGWGVPFADAVQGGTSSVYLHRVWVSLTLGGTNYVLDPALKVSDPIAGLDLDAAMRLDTNELFTTAGGYATADYVTNLNAAALFAKLRDYTTTLRAELRASKPNASVEEVISGSRVRSSSSDPLGGPLAFTPHTNGASWTATNWSNIPTNFMSWLRVSVAGTNRAFWLPELRGRRLALAFSATGVASLWLDDEKVLEKATTGPGTTIAVNFKLDHPFGWWNFTNQVVVDDGWQDENLDRSFQRTHSTNALLYAFDADETQLRARQTRLDAYRQQGLPDTGREILTETLHVMGLNFLVQSEMATRLLMVPSEVLNVFHHRMGRMSQEAGQGYYVDVFLQRAASLSAGGVSGAEQTRAFDVFDTSVYFSSAMKHALIEQLQSSNLVAASTVKMLHLANARGEKVFLADSTNWVGGIGVSNQLTGYTAQTLKNLSQYIGYGWRLLIPRNGSNMVAQTNSWRGYGIMAQSRNAESSGVHALIQGGYFGGYVSLPNAWVNPPFVANWATLQPTYFNVQSASLPRITGADPVSMADGSFQVDATDLTLGQAEPRGLSFSRHYSSARRHHNVAAMAPGWRHNYHFQLEPVSAPYASLGATTPEQVAPMLVATRAALALYRGPASPKLWLMTALIAQWGIDQTISNAVSIVLGKDTLQFVRQPDGAFTPPAGSTMTLTNTGSGHILQERHGNAFHFATNGRLTRIVDPSGAVAEFAYGTNGLLASVADWKCRALTFEYSGTPPRLDYVRDNSGRLVFYDYSAGGDLVRVADLVATVVRYHYDTNHQLTSIVDPDWRIVTTNLYDAFGRVVEQRSEAQPNRTWRFYWSGLCNVEEDPLGGLRRFFYDERHRPQAVQDALGHLAQTYYDGQDHIVLRIAPLTATSAATNRFVYDADHNVVQAMDPAGYTTTYQYDHLHRLTNVIDARGFTHQFEWNPRHQITRATDALGNSTIYEYDPADGTLKQVTDAATYTNAFSYDAWGQLNEVIYSGLVTNRLTNNALGDAVALCDGRGNVTTFTYNYRRQPMSSLAPLNVTNLWDYDLAGNVLWHKNPRGETTAFHYTGTRKVSRIDPPNFFWRHFYYDARDWLEASADWWGRMNRSVYDAAGNVIATVDPLQRTAWMGSDAGRRLQALTNALLETTAFSYDARGLRTTLTDPAGRTIIYHYDAQGNQVALTNRRQQGFTFVFDAANRLLATITPALRTNAQTWNSRGPLASVKEPSGQTATLSYDALGRLTNRTDNVGSTVYRYDPSHNATNITETVNSQPLTVHSAYDALNRVQSYRDAEGREIAYAYDACGNLTNLVYPDGRAVRYAYDDMNRLTDVWDWQASHTQFQYDLGGRLTRITRPNGTVRELTYDNADQTTRIVEKKSNGWVIALFTLRWDAAGRITNEFSAPLPHAYTEPTRDATYDADNRLLTVNGQAVTHDLDGNLTNGPLSGGAWATFSYDARNRLIRTAQASPALSLSYAYDPAGNRIALTNAGAVTRFVINPNAALPQVLMRIRGGVTNYFVYGPGLLYEVTETATSTRTLTYHYDYRGSTVALTDETGNVTDRMEYSPYGTITYRTGTNDTPFLFNGRYGVQTDANGLLYMHARYYNPYLCRFLNADPSGLTGGMNWYAFADGNPVNNLDPFGLGAVEAGRSSWLRMPQWVTDLQEDVRIHGDPMSGHRLSTVLDFVPGGTVAKSFYTLSTGRELGSGVWSTRSDWAVFGEGVVGAASLLALPMRGSSGINSGVRTAAEGTAIRWGPLNGPGPVGEAVANTFRGGSYTESVLSGETTLYRSYGGTAGELGSYWTRTPPAGPLQATMDSALNPAWGNTAQGVSTIRVPAGTTIYEGFAAPQGGLLGGGSQVYIPKVNPNWLVHP